jgi:hypothetical protein
MLDRETLESEALKTVCACQYYDLADYLDSPYILSQAKI